MISSVNLEDKTSLCEIMTRNGSDKGSGHHNYTKVYDYMFKDLCQKELNLLEIGIGTTNPNIPSNMGPNGVVGASLRGWKEYFPKGAIYGADIDHSVLFEEDRIKTHYCDQTSEISVKVMLKDFGVMYDIIIDDGYQNFIANYNTLIHCLEYLNKGGYYIIEDVKNSDVGNYSESTLNHLKERFNLHFIKLVDIPLKSNQYDNRLLVIIK